MTLALHQPGTAVAAPVIGIEGTYNFRGTGGYAVGSGSLRADGLFRSDALHGLTPAGVRQFADQGIVRVIDLRDEHELRTAPSALSECDVETVHHPIFEGAAIPSGAEALTLADVYRTIATDRVQALVGAVRLLADAPSGGVLVHCTAGKDRTGMVVAAALTAVGVHREQVLADYAASAANLAGEWAERMLRSYSERVSGPIDPNVQELVTASPAAALAAALDLIDDRYGGVEPMLLGHGLDDAALDRLHARLVG